MRREKVAAWLGALAVAGTVAAGADSLNAEQNTQSCIDALDVHVPSPKLSDRIWGWGDPKYAKNEASNRKIFAAVDKIKNIGPNNSDRVNALVTCVETSESSRVQEESVAALGRIGTDSAKDALYSIVAGRPEADNATEYAAKLLKKAAPNRAVKAIIQRRSRFGAPQIAKNSDKLDDLTWILVDVGGYEALRHLIGAGRAYALALMVNMHDMQYSAYSNRIIRLINRSMRYDNGPLLCGTPPHVMYEFGRAIRKLGGPVYAESLAEEVWKEMRYSCVLEWAMPGKIDSGRRFLNGLRGKQ